MIDWSFTIRSYASAFALFQFFSFTLVPRMEFDFDQWLGNFE